MPSPTSKQYQPIITSDLEATILISTALSDAIDLHGTTLVGYIMPAAWTAAALTLQGSADGINFFDVYDKFGTEEVHTVDVDRFVVIDAPDLAALRFLKLRSGTAATPVNQAAEAKITLVTRAV